MSRVADPIAYTPDVERIEPDEAETAQAIIAQMTRIIDQTDAIDGHAVRSVHAKSHAILQGALTVHDDLAPELAQGVFVPGARYDALVRVSTIPGDVLRDSVSVPRGIAVKLFGVTGARLDGAEGEVTQDFTMASGPVFSAPDAKSFLKSLKLLAGTTERAEWAKAAMSAILRPVERAIEAIGLSSPTLNTFGGYQPTNPLGQEYYSQTAYRHGDYIAKLRLVPAAGSIEDAADERVDLDDPNAIREAVIATLARQGGAWTLEVQLCRDLKKMPVEDASVEWSQKLSPFLPVATLAVPAQEAWSAARSAAVDEGVAFRPWQGVEAHRPLGNVNRARKPAYPASVAHRSRLTGCPVHEPRTMPVLD